MPYVSRLELSNFIVSKQGVALVREENAFIGEILHMASHVKCGDGTAISVQAGRFYRCSPRSDTPPPEGYESYEVWSYPGEREEPETWTWTEVNDYISEHGGAVS